MDARKGGLPANNNKGRCVSDRHVSISCEIRANYAPDNALRIEQMRS